jgi:caffeoyl-CoA O-methyltransferase
MYLEFYDLVVPRLTPGGLLVADNVLSHAEQLHNFVEGARRDHRVDAAVLPVGKGLLVCIRREG